MVFEPLKKNNLPEYNDSLEEVYFEWWLEELIIEGYIIDFRRSDRFKLASAVSISSLKHSPLKSNPNRYLLVERSLLQQWTYTPDYDILWTDKAYNILFQDINIPNDTKLNTYFYAVRTALGYLSVVDVKPIAFGSVLSSSVKFPNNQKKMMEKFNIYVNKVCPTGKSSLFDKTFTPDRFLLQNVKPIKRKINPKYWTPISLKTFFRNNENIKSK